VPAEASPFAGQAALEPLHDSATSHVPDDGRQTVLLGRKPSDGQVGPAPLHDSATSHAPDDGRQVPDDA
jgi:hypothetical protein